MTDSGFYPLPCLHSVVLEIDFLFCYFVFLMCSFQYSLNDLLRDTEDNNLYEIMVTCGVLRPGKMSYNFVQVSLNAFPHFHEKGLQNHFER